MVDTEADWRVTAVADRDAALRFLSRDRVANGYALCDLEPPFEDFSVVALAYRGASTEPEAACLTLSDPSFTAMVTFGDAGGLAAILDRIELPVSAHIALAFEHRQTVERLFTLDHVSERWRMAVDSNVSGPPAPSVRGLRVLGPDDTGALLDLYSTYDASFFLPAQLVHGVFYGVHEHGRLVAAAGTHTLGRRAALAAVGNVYTRPEARGRGYAAAATSAVLRDLLTLGCRDVVLNVAVTNGAAIRVYERLGFTRHSRYLEAMALRTR